MRTFVRVVAVVVLLLGVVLTAAVVLLPRWIESAGFNERLQTIAEQQLGRRVRWDELSVGVLPPRLVVERVEVQGSLAADAVRVEMMDLVFSWEQLFARRLVVDAVELTGARLRIVRDADGAHLAGLGHRPTFERSAWNPAAAAPVAWRPAQASGGALQAPEPEVEPSEIGELRLHDSEILLEDRTLSPPRTWRLLGVGGTANSASRVAPIVFEMSGHLEAGGELRATGRATREGQIESDLELDSIALEPFHPYVDAATKLVGRADGTARVSTRPQGLEIAAAIAISDADIAFDDLTLRGPFSVEATLGGPADALSGPFEAVVTQAEIDYAGAVRKPVGEHGLLRGELRLEDGLEADYRLELRNLRGRGKATSSPRTRVTIDAPPFDIAGWDALVPALLEFSPAGSMDLRGFSVSTDPLALGGAIGLNDVKAHLEPGRDFTFRGEIAGQRDSLVLRNVSATRGETRLAVEGGIEGLATEPRYRIRLLTPEAVESDHVFSFFDLPGLIFGALQMDLDLAITPSDEEGITLVEQASGTMRARVGGDEAGGRIRGVSLLKLAFEQLGPLSDAVVATVAAASGKEADDLFSERFLVAQGSYRIANGEAHTEDLEFVHSQYRIALDGSIRLTDWTLDMKGEIEVSPELDAWLQGAKNVEGGRKRVLPIARLSGEIGAPRIKLDRAAATEFAARYLLASPRVGVRKTIDGFLGEGATEQLRDILGGSSP